MAEVVQSTAARAAVRIVAKKRRFVRDGVFKAELNELLSRELSQDGYCGVDVRVTPARTEIIIRATNTQSVLGEKGRRIRELTSLVQQRFNFPDSSMEIFVHRIENRGLSAVAQVESLRYKLLYGMQARRACHSVLRFIMEAGAKGCECVIAGKLRGARAKAMKFKDGYLISSGQPKNDLVDRAVRNVSMRAGMLGVTVQILLPHDPTGKSGGSTATMPDKVCITMPKGL